MNRIYPLIWEKCESTYSKKQATNAKPNYIMKWVINRKALQQLVLTPQYHRRLIHTDKIKQHKAKATKYLIVQIFKHNIFLESCPAMLTKINQLSAFKICFSY